LTRQRAEDVTFSFGRNWQRFLDELHPRAVMAMTEYFADWIPEGLTGASFLDVGSGSGLASLVAHQLGANVTSMDLDPASVDATKRLWELAGQPASWRVVHGSILDESFVSELGSSDLVLAWGVLHHTGRLWTAIDHAARLVGPGGRLWIALYTKTRSSPGSLRTKRLYNRTPNRLKPLFRGAYAGPKLVKMSMKRDFSPIRRYHEERGMSWWRDIEDWLGGLPYEVAAPGEVHDFLKSRGFKLERLKSAAGEGDTDVYLFQKAIPT
jgi:2-polyprenyl-6-hydroxyphenyl methylase/3-demethylubiquinone-9 3-methyltransferase